MIERQLKGNVGGAMLAGDTVRRAVGPWTPAVHALLRHLRGQVPHVPRVHGFDERGREVLDYLPGRVYDAQTEPLTPERLVSVVEWTRAFHRAVADFSHAGPWRYFPPPRPTIIGHNDIAPYNVCFRGDRLAGVFDWDMAGPTTPLWELAFIAWNCVPLWADIGPDAAARRLRIIADAYRGRIGPADIVHAVPERINALIDGIPVAAAGGDPGMANLLANGAPEHSRAALAGLVERIPCIAARL